jgi:hypothetical protein
MNELDEMIAEMKSKIISTLGLMDVKPEDIQTDAPLVGGRSGA